MWINALITSILFGLSLFIFILAFSAVAYERGKKKGRNATEDDSWLLSNLNDQVFDFFFPRRLPEDVAASMGIKAESYYQDCTLARVAPNIKKLVVHYVYGLLLLIAFIIVGGITRNYYVFLAGIFCFLYFAYFEKRSVHAKAEAMRDEMANDLPRFLDLLQAELEVGLPIENAIYILCEKMDDTLLAREFMEALNEMKIGLNAWQEALINLAEKYDVETLSDFVLNVTTAYTRGVSITKTVKEKSEDIKTAHLLRVKEKAGSATNTILIPITVCQFLPMMIFIMFPALEQVMNGLM